jgi:hypothetical protein
MSLSDAETHQLSQPASLCEIVTQASWYDVVVSEARE